RPTLHYWITSSARDRSDGGIARPSALAVLRLMTKSNFAGCSTGRVARFGALQDLIHEVRSTATHVVQIFPIGHEAAGARKPCARTQLRVIRAGRQACRLGQPLWKGHPNSRALVHSCRARTP